MIYIVILLLLLYLSYNYDICGKERNREFWYVTVLCVFILLAGLRWRVGIDTIRYTFHFYYDYPSLDHFSFKDYGLGTNPLFVFLNSLVKTLGGRFFIVQLVQAAFVNVLIMNYFKKHTKYIFTCAVFYFCISFSGIMMEAMKASFSIAISLYAFDYFIEKKWLKGYILLIVATMFHAQTLVLFLFPAFLFLRLNKNGLFVLIGAYFLGMILQGLLSDYIFLFEDYEEIEDKLMSYSSEDSSYGVYGRNITYYLLHIVPNIIYPLSALWYVKKNSQNQNIKKFEPLIILGVTFVLIWANYRIAYRYVDYFEIYFALFFAECTAGISIRTDLSRGLAYIQSLALFFPLLISLVYFVSFREPRYIYTSVMNREIIVEKEIWFMNHNNYYPPSENEY